MKYPIVTISIVATITLGVILLLPARSQWTKILDPSTEAKARKAAQPGEWKIADPTTQTLANGQPRSATPAQKWEYTRIVVDSGENHTSQLNENGKDGWELVGFQIWLLGRGPDSETIYLLKRPLK